MTLVMGIKQASDYDGQIAPYRFGYVKAVETSNYMVAAHFVELINNTLTPGNRIDDLPSFSMEPKSFEEKKLMPNTAMKYCYKYMPIVERACSNERASLYNFYKAGM